MSSANETQVGGNHYKGGTEHWDFTVAALRNRYLEGQITKYASRHRRKNGKEDVLKARHFLAKLREVHANGATLEHVTEHAIRTRYGLRGHPTLERLEPAAPGRHSSEMLIAVDYVRSQKLDADETLVILGCTNWRNDSDLEVVDRVLVRLLDQYEMRTVLQGEPVALGVSTTLEADVAEPNKGYVQQD